MIFLVLGGGFQDLSARVSTLGPYPGSLGQDGQDFKVEVNVAKQSEVLEARFRKDGTEKPLELANLTGKTLAKIVEILNGMQGKKSDKDKIAFLRNSIPDNSPDLGLVLKAVDYLFLRDPVVINVIMDAFGRGVFEHDLKYLRLIFDEMEPQKQKDAYAKYLNNVLPLLESSDPSPIPENLQSKIIQRGLLSIDRIFIDNSPDRRLKAIESINDTDDPLVVAQVIAYIAKYQVPSAKELPKPLQDVLKDWLGNDFAGKIHFGPWPTEFATWPRHCPLPSNPNYDMYSDATPDDRYIDNGDGTVTDVCTKLTWEQAPSMPPAPLQQSLDHCAKLNKASFTDWRAPTRIELQSIVNYAASLPALNPMFHDGNDRYWSSTPEVHLQNNAWAINFESGNVYPAVVKNHRMRCVRGERGGSLSAGAKRHFDYNDGSQTVTDNFTGAVWQRFGNLELGSMAAQTYCTKLDLAGKGWSLPTVKMLSTLFYVGLKERIDTDAFPETDNDWHWSSSPSNDSNAWSVGFWNGYINPYRLWVPHPGRCVR